MIDTTRRLETPEGVELALRVAGPVVRAYAWAVDLGIRLVAYTVFAIALAFLGNVGTGLFLVVFFFGEWFYPVYFEVKRDGSTPGKRRFGLQVLHDDGTPVGWGAATVRNLLRFADFLPAAYGFGLAAMLLHPDFKRLGDLAAGTLVVYREEGWFAVVPGVEIPLAEPAPPPTALALDEQRAVLEFGERFSAWSPQRASELATLARPLTGRSGHEAVVALVAMANWLLGRRLSPEQSERP